MVFNANTVLAAGHLFRMHLVRANTVLAAGHLFRIHLVIPSVYINKQKKTQSMSKVLDAVDLRKTSRAESIFATFPKSRAVFDVVPHSGPHEQFDSKQTHSSFAVERASAQPKKMSTVHVLWFVCVCCMSIPFVAGLIASRDPDHATFPYQCNLFFLSLVVGLPGASVHLFCCSLCLFTRNRFALVAFISSIFLHILTVEYACGVRNTDNFSFYLMVGSIVTGAAAQLMIVETLNDSRTRQRSTAVTAFFSMLLVTTAISFLTALVSDVFKIHLKAQKRIYLQAMPLVLSQLAYVFSSFLTLKPVFLVIETLSMASL